MGVAERREREREQRREHIIDAAERVFFAKGAVHTTMDDVAATAELSKGTLYLYFKSKDELYVAIGLRCLRMLLDRLTDSEDTARSGLEQMRRYTQVKRDFVQEHPERFQTMVAWLASGFHADTDMPCFEAYQQASAAVFERIVHQIRRGQLDGSIRADIDPHMCALQLWGGSLGVSLLHFNRAEIQRRLPFAVDFDSLVPSFMDVLLSTMRNDPGTGERDP